MTHPDDRPFNPAVKILLADDQPDDLQALEAILRDTGAELVTARSGTEALDLLSAQDYAVVLLEVRLRDLDGFETARGIRAREGARHTPIIFLSAFEGPDFPVDEAYTLGAVDYLVKPWVPVILRAKVAGFVELFLKTEQIKHQADQLRQAERREADEARLRLASLVESSDDAIIGKTLDGVITSWNRGAERVFGYTEAEALGRPITILAVPGREPDMPPILERIRRGERVDHYETVRRRKDGRDIVVSLAISPIHDAAGNVVGVSKIARDITEHKHLEAELRRRAEQLAEADRRKDQFLATLGHELRNPLAPIRTAVELLRQSGAAGPQAEQARGVIERQVQHMARLVDDLLDVGRIQHGKIALRKERVALEVVVAHAVETAQPLIEARGHRLAVELPPGPVWLEADPVRLEQVLANLLSNAAKYTEPEGQIRLTAGCEGGEVALRVQDNGVGIPPEMLERIFDLFTQLDHLPDRSSQWGLGVGLSLVRNLVHLHGGTICAHSAGLGQGSEFVVRSPYAAQAPPASASADRAPANGRPLSVLVTDDNVDAAEMVALVLRFAGHDVRVAHDGPETLRAAVEHRPEVVLLDIGLPGMNGYEVARQLRGLAGLEGTLLVALTGYGQDEDRRRSREAGFDLHLVKPVDPAELLRILTVQSLTAGSAAQGAGTS